MKNVFIFGDSYSAFEGWVPEGHELHYYIGREECDVKTVEDMWWYPLLPEIGGSLVLNDSWSGSTIGYTGYFNADCSETNSLRSVSISRAICSSAASSVTSTS